MINNTTQASSSLPGSFSRLIATEVGDDQTRFDYLFQLAKRESGFNPSAKAPTSSAYGLFQFIDQTWLNLIEQHDDELDFSSKINDFASLSDADRKARILEMRADPETSVKLASILTKQNQTILQDRIGRPPTSAELYFAHFMGPANAGDLITASGKEIAAERFPKAASANRTIFYDGGLPRTIADVRTILADGFGKAGKAGKEAGADDPTRSENISSVQPVTNQFFFPNPVNRITSHELLIYSALLDFNFHEKDETWTDSA